MPKTPQELAAEAASKAAAEKAAADAAAQAAIDATNGFPSNTKVEDMQPLEQAAYWRDQSKKQQKIAESRADYDAQAAKAAELEALKAANATDAEKAVEEARREGENIGAERYLKDAVKGRFQALTGKSEEEVETAFAHVDPKSFTDDKGEIVAEKLKAFADVFGTKDDGKNQQKDPVAEALARQRAAGGGTGSSISEKRKEVRESMTKTKA